MVDVEATYDRIKTEFCGLFEFKSRGGTLEVITPLATLTSKFVSVFITKRDSRYIVTDGGWICDDVYDNSFLEEENSTISTIVKQFKSYYNIKETKQGDTIYYYRAVDDLSLLSAAVFDVANFVVGAVNSYALEFSERKGKEERDKFRSETNSFLKDKYNGGFESNFEPVKGLKFSATLRFTNKIHLIEYVSGHTPHYFESDLRRAMVNFQLIEETSTFQYIGTRVAILNDSSTGYAEGRPPILVEYLDKATDSILTRANRSEILSIIPPKKS